MNSKKKSTLAAAVLAAALGTLGAAAHAQGFNPHGDMDRDGIQNQYDRDRDGDGIANARDPNPNRYDRHARNDRGRRGPDRFGPMGDMDRDGIANRDDRDRDGDGVANRRDNYPNDRRYM